MLPYGKQTIDDDDIAAVVAALKSDYLTSGPEVEAFEREFAEMVGSKHAVAVCNATAALHLAMLVADIGPGDRVVTSPNTFLASANCAAYVGATPDFADIDPISYNLCPKALEATWQKDTKAVVAVAYAGQAANMLEIARVARARGAIVIEDGCHGPGGGFEYNGQIYKIGGHPWADMTTFSFHPVKSMTTGEGGMLVTDNDQYAEKARLLRSHGMVRDPAQFKVFQNKEQPPSALSSPSSGLTPQASGFKSPPSLPHGPWTYEMQGLGYNYRITDIQCALGRRQLKKLPGFIKRRQEIVGKYNEAFKDIPWIQTPGLSPEPQASTHSPPPSSLISWHLYTMQIDFAKIGKSRSEVMAELRAAGVGTQVLYIPVYLQPWYQETYGYQQGKCPEAESYYSRAISIPLYPKLTDVDLARVIKEILSLANG